MSSLTEEFRRVLPFALYSTSPKLSALHTTRGKLSALKNGTLPSNISSSLCCAKCGLLQFAGRGTSQGSAELLSDSRALGVSNNSKKALSRPIARAAICANCGATRPHLPASAAKRSMPSVRHMKKRRNRTINNEPDTSASEIPTTPICDEAGAISRSPSTAPVTQTARLMEGSTGKSRPKKRVGLQEMLARNRAQKEKSAAEAKHRAGLAYFLVGL